MFDCHSLKTECWLLGTADVFTFLQLESESIGPISMHPFMCMFCQISPLYNFRESYCPWNTYLLAHLIFFFYPLCGWYHVWDGSVGYDSFLWLTNHIRTFSKRFLSHICQLIPWLPHRNNDAAVWVALTERSKVHLFLQRLVFCNEIQASEHRQSNLVRRPLSFVPLNGRMFVEHRYLLGVAGAWS